MYLRAERLSCTRAERVETAPRELAIISLFFPHNMSAAIIITFLYCGPGAKWFFVWIKCAENKRSALIE